VLVVLDPTSNPKLDALRDEFRLSSIGSG
jgi:hypothetical protein